MAGSFVGLDIGSNQIKVAELRRAGNQVQVVALGVAPTPPEAYENNVVIDAQLLGQAVKNLLKQQGITTKDCVSSVAGASSVVVRVIEVPQMNTAELAETMKWEVERHVPFAASEVIMDYTPIERPEGYAEGQNMDVLLAVAQQDMVDRHVEMLMAAGLKPKYIDVEPLALGRTLLDINETPMQAGHTVAIINLGATNTDIDIYRDKLLCFPRTLPLAGDSFTRAIAESMHVDLATAEQYKREFGEVITDQFAQPQSPGFGGMGGGFVDFSGGPPPSPFDTPPSGQPAFTSPQTGPSSSPSGRMPFDFSTPGDSPPTPFDAAGQPAPNPFGTPQDENPSPDFMRPGQPQELQPAEPGFFTPGGATPPPPAQNLPAPSGGSGDPNRDAMRMQVFSAIAPILAELAQELRRSIDYYRGRASDAQIHEIQLTGGTARLKNLATFLEMELGIPTRVADPLQSVQVTAKNFSDTYLSEVSSLFPISIGLGVRDLIGGPAPAKKRK